MSAVNAIVKVLIARGEDPDEARRSVKDARKRVAMGEDPEEILYEEFGLEPDYVMDLL